MSWNEEDHPRGQPDNSGQFIKKDTSGATDGSDYKKPQYLTRMSAHEGRTEAEQKRMEELGFEDERHADDISELLGEEFTGVKGQAAVEKLLREKRGHVKAAFHRDDIGDIDLLWGNDSLGLQHIIKQREKEKEGHAQEIMSDLSDAIERGVFKKRNNRGNFEFKYEKSYVVIAPEYHGNKITYVLTAYKRN